MLVEEIKTCLCLYAPGKSALHWAAAVNNVDAAVVLLKNGANKDMQNNKVQHILDK